MGEDARIEVPTGVEAILSEDRALMESVFGVLESFGRWMDVSSMSFFPEYTQHGAEHVASVLRSAWHLLGNCTCSALSARDAACLVLGCLFHDSGMFISEDGLKELLTTDHVVPGFGDRPWHELWAEFYCEATRWDKERCLEVYGEPEPLVAIQLDPLAMTKKERLTIGVFIRRHHHRLAHEIATRGVPGPRVQRLSAEAVPEAIRYDAGVVARSHGQTLARSLEGLTSPEAQDVQQAKMAALMAALRVADYLDAHPGRAPDEVTLTRRANSPRSDIEYKLNQCIISIDEDPKQERWIRVMCNPPDAVTFIAMRDWLDGLQRELDSAEAILSDISFRRRGMIRLRYSRVKSNLDDTDAFARTVDYVPADIRLRVAENDLVRLLVNPLYGDAPEIGIRELVQNAVDAVRERDAIERSTGVSGIPGNEGTTPDVRVALERSQDGRAWVVVEDRGIGMSLPTVENFFLRVGATYRRSTEWRLRFEPSPGEAAVLRSGRFGIGVLAAFLLGRRVYVETRHVDASEENGLCFVVDLNGRCIDLRRARRDVGTTIRVEADPAVWSKLAKNAGLWDWYHLAWPSLKRYIEQRDGQMVEQEPTFMLPAFRGDLPSQWHSIETDNYPEIHWSFVESAPKLSCNGIAIETPGVNLDVQRVRPRVSDGFGPLHHIRKGFVEIRTLPNVSVFDPHGRLPLNLERTGLTSFWLPFAQTLYEDVMKDLVAAMLQVAPGAPPCEKCSLDDYKQPIPYGYPGRLSLLTRCAIDSDGLRWLPWFATSTAAGPTTYWSIAHSGARGIRFVTVNWATAFRGETLPQELLAEDKLLVVIQLDDSHRTPVAKWMDFLLRCSTHNCMFNRLRAASHGLLIRHSLVDWTLTLKRLPKGLKSELVRSAASSGMCVLTEGAPSEEAACLGELARVFKTGASGIVAVADWGLDEVQPPQELSLFEEIWRSAFDRGAIPYDPKARRELAESASRYLGRHVSSHAELAEAWRRDAEARRKEKGSDR